MRTSKRILLLILLLAVVSTTTLWFLSQKSSANKEIGHVILISIDTCRADHLSCYGYPEETTPNIDRFANGADLFENVVSPIPITLPAHSSMFTGTIPPTHGVHNNVEYKLADSNLTLPEILQDNGFETSAVVSSFVLTKQFGLNQGFDTYNDKFDRHKVTYSGNERIGDETTLYGLKWIEANKDKKSFLFLHYYDPHDDYVPPEPFASNHPDSPYAGEIAFVDDCLGQFFQKLKDEGIYDSSLIILVGDHGEMLGEHGEEEHTYFIYESAIKVPLIIKRPGQNKPTRVSKVVGLIDVLPTICSLLNIDIPEQSQGMDLFAAIEDRSERYYYSESLTPTQVRANSLMSVTGDQWKYIQTTRPELYDLSEDPEENNDLADSQPQRARILQDRLRQILELSVRQKDENSKVELSEEAIKRLESLGYIAGKVNEDFQFDQDKPDPKDLIGFHVQMAKASDLVFSKEFEKAKDIYKQLLKENPQHNNLNSRLASIAMQQKRAEEAITYYDAALKNDPTLYEACNSIGYIRLRQRRIKDAIEFLTQSLKIKPDQPKLLNDVAWIKATSKDNALRDPEEALRLALRLLKLTGNKNPNVLDTLAAAYAAAGEYDKAVATATKAIELAVSKGQKELAQDISRKLKLYKNDQPYIE